MGSFLSNPSLTNAALIAIGNSFELA
jgi:hypothetical protein